MGNRLVKMGAVFMGALGGVWSVVEVYGQGVTTAAAVFGLSALGAAVYGLLLIKKDYYGVAVERFIHDTSSPSTYYVDVVNDPGELKIVAELDKKEYGEDSVDYKVLESWWQRYQKGVYVLWKNSEIVGAFGMWPIKKTTFEELSAGKRHEHEIYRRSICEEKDRPFKYWYAADIIYNKNFKFGFWDSPIHFLLTEAIGKWLDSGDVDSDVRICALAIRGADQKLGRGEQILRRYGFKAQVSSCPSRNDRMKAIPVYVRRTSLQALQEDYRKLREDFERVRSRVGRENRRRIAKMGLEWTGV